MMDILGWIGWLAWSVLALLWSLVWLLLGGWIATAAQIVVVVMAIFIYRYGWRQAPAELWRQLRAIWRFASGAMQASDALAEAREDRRRSAVAERARARRKGPRHRGDVTINLSTALSVLLLVVLWALSGAA